MGPRRPTVCFYAAHIHKAVTIAHRGQGDKSMHLDTLLTNLPQSTNCVTPYVTYRVCTLVFTCDSHYQTVWNFFKWSKELYLSIHPHIHRCSVCNKNKTYESTINLVNKDVKVHTSIINFNYMVKFYVTVFLLCHICLFVECEFSLISSFLVYKM